MKIAIISVSDKGFELSKILKNKLDDDSTIIKTDLYHKNVKKHFPILFYEYDAIIAIMASGILIRSIAPLIESKISDPAGPHPLVSPRLRGVGGRPEPCGIVKPDRVLRGIDHGFRSVHTDRHDPVLHSGPLPALKEELQILGRLDKGNIFISFDAVSSDRIIGPECQFFVDMAVFPCDGNILRGYLRVLRCGSRG